MSNRVCLGVIPARIQSTRFPKKVVAPILNKPMIQYVWEAAWQAIHLDDLLIATGDDEVAEVARGFGAQVAMTPNDFATGTDRVAYVAKDSGAEIVVNLQGDEPLITADIIDRLVRSLTEREPWGMATVVIPTTDERVNQDPNVVKAVVNAEGVATDFTREAVARGDEDVFYRHVGIYAYRAELLQAFCSWPPSPREQQERLEQLRALERGVVIGTVVSHRDLISVDVPSDLDKVVEVLGAGGLRERIKQQKGTA